jgi:hypothetical protein
MRFGLSMAGVNTQYLDIPVGMLLLIIVASRGFSGKGFSSNLIGIFRKR